MNELVGGTKKTKNRNFLFFAAAISAILVIAVFLFIVLKYTEEKKETYRVPSIPKERTLEELTRDLTGTRNEETFKPIPSGDIESLTASVNRVGNSNTDNKNIKPEKPAQASIPAEDLRSLTATSK